MIDNKIEVEDMGVLLHNGLISVDEILEINGGVVSDPHYIAYLEDDMYKNVITKAEYEGLTGRELDPVQVHIWVGEEHVSANPTVASLKNEKKLTTVAAAANGSSVGEIRQRIVQEQRYQSIADRAAKKQVQSPATARSQMISGILAAVLLLLVILVGVKKQDDIKAFFAGFNARSAQNVASGSDAAIPSATPAQMSPIQAALPGGGSSSALPVAENGIGSTGTYGGSTDITTTVTMVNGEKMIQIGGSTLDVPCAPVWSSPAPSWAFDEAVVREKLLSERQGCYNTAGYGNTIHVEGWYGDTDWILVLRPKSANAGPNKPEEWDRVWAMMQFFGLSADDVRATPGAKDYAPAPGAQLPASAPTVAPVAAQPTVAPVATAQPTCDGETNLNAAVRGPSGYAVGCSGVDALLAANPGMQSAAVGHAAVMEFLQIMRAAPVVAAATSAPTSAPNIGSNGEPCNPGNAKWTHKITDESTGIVGVGYSCTSEGAAWDMAQKSLDEDLAKYRAKHPKP